MNERIIEIILYLVNQLRQDTPMDLIDVQELSESGYTDAEIGAAFSWLADRSVIGRAGRSRTERKSFRVLSDVERTLFTQDAYGYLLQLVEIGLLSDMELEVVINRSQLTATPPLQVEDVKDVVSNMLAESTELGFGGSRLMLISTDMVN